MKAAYDWKTSLLLVSLAVNADLVWLLWRPAQEPRRQRETPAAAHSRNSTGTEVALSEPGSDASLAQRSLPWSQIEADNYQAYVANLRRVGCPEATVRDIIIADVRTVAANPSLWGGDPVWAQWKADPDGLAQRILGGAPPTTVAPADLARQGAASKSTLGTPLFGRLRERSFERPPSPHRQTVLPEVMAATSAANRATMGDAVTASQTLQLYPPASGVSDTASSAFGVEEPPLPRHRVRRTPPTRAETIREYVRLHFGERSYVEWDIRAAQTGVTLEELLSQSGIEVPAQR